jgi:hypothetical protein
MPCFEELEHHAAIIRAGYEYGYTVTKEAGVWVARFVSYELPDFGVGHYETERDTAGEAFEWCISHQKAVESLLPKEAV